MNAGRNRTDAFAFKAILFVAGGVALGVGAGILLFPVAFYATNDIALSGQASLLNEVRASGGAILALGMYVFAACFVPRLRVPAATIAALVYLAYGASRVLSVALDGMPATPLVLVALLEFVIGGACLFAVLRYRAPIQADA